MIVTCKVIQCPYHSWRGFCRNKLLNISENGLCMHIYGKNGQPKQEWTKKIDEKYMEQEVYQEKEATDAELGIKIDEPRIEDELNGGPHDQNK